VTQEALEGRLRKILLNEEAPIRALALASAAHGRLGGDTDDGSAAAAAPNTADDDDGTIQLWPPQNPAPDPSACVALSTRGAAQCAAIQHGWLEILRELHPPRGLILTAPEAACRETAELVLGGTYQPNGDHYQYVALDSLGEPMAQIPEPDWEPKSEWETLEACLEAGGERAEDRGRRHALRIVHDLVVELERDAVLYPWLNEPRGANGSAVLVFGHGLYNASVALLLCEMLELGWRSKRDVLGAPLEPGGLLLVSSESVRYFDAPAADE